MMITCMAPMKKMPRLNMPPDEDVFDYVRRTHRRKQIITRMMWVAGALAAAAAGYALWMC
jgi:predicted DNA-binding protein with PD1-like motif